MKLPFQLISFYINQAKLTCVDLNKHNKNCFTIYAKPSLSNLSWNRVNLLKP